MVDQVELRAELLGLAERCEQATGPDRELDFYVWAALNGVTEITNPAEGHPMTPGRGGRVEGRDADGEWHLYGFVDPGTVNHNWTPYGGEDRYPRYTASLDAAITLVPYVLPEWNGEAWNVSAWRTNGVHAAHIRASAWVLGAARAMAATPALALCAAALRARAAQGIEAATADETAQTGSVHESPVGKADTPNVSGLSHTGGDRG